MRRLLITGASGFVGTALCQKMVTSGSRVRGTVRSSSQTGHLPGEVELFNVDSIGPYTDWKKALKGVDTVIHLAARVHLVKKNTTDPPALFHHVNVDGTRRLAEMAADAGIKRMIYMSSVKVNGEEREAPYTEQDQPKPQGPYAISKWEAEQVLREISDNTGLEVVILRPPLVYGPGVKANFRRLLKTVERGIPLPFIHINNRRSLIYLGNLVDAVATVSIHPEAAGQTYLVSDDDDVSTPELIRRVGFALGCRVRLFPFSPKILRTVGRIIGRSDTVEKVIGSLTVECKKIQGELGWKMPFTMFEGLKSTAEWYLRNKNKEVNGV